MKAIKIILGIVTVLVIIFFSTGLLVKETAYHVEVEIDRSIEEVFLGFNNHEIVKEWMPDMKSFEVLNSKPGTVGSEYKLTFEKEGQVMVMKEKVMAFVPNKKLTLFIEADGMLKTDDFNFSTLNGKTIISVAVSCKSDSYITSCVFPYFKGVFTEIDQQYLNAFKAYIENN
jgi:uncharacterized membrane protein